MAVTNTLTWNANTEPDLKEYWVYRAIGSAVLAKVAIVPKGTQTYVDTVTADGDYGYALTAVDVRGNESLKSVTVTKTVDQSPPAAPTGLAIT